MRTSRVICIFVAAVLAAVLTPAIASAVDSVVVVSKTVPAGATGATISVRLINGVALSAIVIPLVVREFSAGSFITSLRLSYADRLASPAVLENSLATNQYADENGTCRPGPHGGFTTITFTDGGPHPVIASPEGLLFARMTLTAANLAPGSDVAGSLVLTVNVSGTPGSFEIDTTCTNPANHLGFSEAGTGNPILPDFNKGVITVSSDLPLCFSPAVEYATGTDPQSVCAADLDGDGDQDLVVANYSSNNVSVLVNNGDGTYAAAVNYTVGTNPTSVFAANVDQDGDLDLAVANFGSNNVSVLKNNGDGTFAAAVSYAAGFGPSSVFAANLSAYGAQDLVVANRTGGSVSILRNNGYGFFYPAYDRAVGSYPYSVFAADLDGDGVRDLAVANDHSNNVSVLINNGAGSFAPAVNYAAGTAPQSVVAADLEGDGDLDLAVANWGSANVSVLKNNGNGTFATAVNYAAGTYLPSVFAADLDGDGDPDLAVANQGSNKVSVLQNNGDGTFASAVNWGAGSGPISVFAADLDGDWDQDLAVANIGSDRVSVLLNCSLPGPFRVTHLGNSGAGSLRAAIDAANSSIFPNSITFAVAGTIHLATPLPALTDAATSIRGFTAPGAASPGTSTVILDGSSAAPGAALMVQSSNIAIEGLMFRNFNGPGIAVTGLLSISNTITGCLFYGNTGPGIDLGNDGITLNDPLDLDPGPNTLLNYPVFDSVIEPTPGTFNIFGSAKPSSRVALYLAAEAGNPAYQPESTTHGPAHLFLGLSDADQSGFFSFSSIALPEWSRVTATATDLGRNTSELALDRILVPSPLKVTAYSEPVPPLDKTSSFLPQASPAVIMIVYGPPSRIDSIGPTFNTFGSEAHYDSLFDYNTGGLVDTRVTISSPDTGLYEVEYILQGSPGTYVTGIGIDGHADVKQNVSFAAAGQAVTASFHVGAPLRGELTGDGVFDVMDVLASIGIVFSNKPLPEPPELIDVNCDGVPDVLDVLYIIKYVFVNGPAPCQ